MDIKQLDDVAIRSIISLIVLFVITKLLGKKQVSQLSVFDYVIGISIGNVVAEMSVNKEVAFWDGVYVMVIYALIALFISYITTKSIWIRRFIGGVPIKPATNKFSGCS